MKNVLTILFSFVIGLLFSQDWEPVNQGLNVSAGFSTVEKIIIDQESGDVFVGGAFRLDSTPIGLARLDRISNSWDTIYGHVPCEDFNFYNGDLVAAGFFTPASFEEGARFYKWEGDQWTHFVEGPTGIIFESKVIDNKLYLAGGIYLIDEQPTHGLAIFDGVNFYSIDGGHSNSSHRFDDIEKFQDEIYVVGKYVKSGDENDDWTNLAKISGDSLVGVHEEFTGSFFQLWLYELQVYQNELFIGGVFNTSQGFTDNGIQSFDGVDMHEVGGGVNAPILDMKVYEGELYVAGKFGRIGEGVEWLEQSGELCIGLAKWNGESWTCLNTEPWPTTGGYFNTIDIYNDTLYVGGKFSSLGGDTLLSGIARKRIYPDTTLTAIQETTLPNLQIYPNPSSGTLTVRFGETVNEQGSIALYNTMGQQVMKVPIEAGWREYQIETTNLPPGMYVVDIQFGEARMTERIVLER